jgi:hypothetical protein
MKILTTKNNSWKSTLQKTKITVAIIVLCSFASYSWAQEVKPWFSCSQSDLKLEVFSAEGYAESFIKVTEKVSSQSINVTDEWAGSGSCRYFFWDFKYDQKDYSLEMLGCNHGSIKVPENANGRLTIDGNTDWCY